MNRTEGVLPTRRDFLLRGARIAALIAVPGLADACKGSQSQPPTTESSPRPYASLRTPEPTAFPVIQLEQLIDQPGSYYNGVIIHLGEVSRARITLTSTINPTDGSRGEMVTYDMPYIDQTGNKHDAKNAFIGGFSSITGHSPLLWFVDVNLSGIDNSINVAEAMAFNQQELVQSPETNIKGRMVKINNPQYQVRFGDYAFQVTGITFGDSTQPPSQIE